MPDRAIGARHAHESQAKDDDAASAAVVGCREWATTHAWCACGGGARGKRKESVAKVGGRGAQKRTRRKTNERCLPETIEACVEQGLLAFYVTNPCCRSPSPPLPYPPSPLADPTVAPSTHHSSIVAASSSAPFPSALRAPSPRVFVALGT